MARVMLDAGLRLVDGGHVPRPAGVAHFGALVTKFPHRFDRAT